MGKNTAENVGSGWPSPGVLLLCAALVAAGYGMAVLRGPAPAQEVRVLIETAHQEAYDILVINRDVLDRLVLELLEKETLDKAEVEAVFADLRLRDPRPAWTGSALRKPDTRGPVDTPAPSPNGHLNGRHPEKIAVEPAIDQGEA